MTDHLHDTDEHKAAVISKHDYPTHSEMDSPLHNNHSRLSNEINRKTFHVGDSVVRSLGPNVNSYGW